jgi:predicted TIM-barrel fold metal-dependent hydrolase
MVPANISQMIFTGVFERFPELHIAWIETGVGWLPHFLEMMDDRYWRNRNWVGFDLREPPSHYWHTNCAATFMHDFSGIALRHSVGVQNMMWSSDNPHHGNDWPYSRLLINQMMHDVDPTERQLLCAGNAMRIYRLENLAAQGKNGARANGARRPAAKRKAAAR